MGRGHALGTQSNVDGGPGPPGFHENDHVLNDWSVNRGAVPQRGPVIHENDHVVNYLFPSTEVHGNEPITYTSDAPSIDDRDDFDIERDESMSEELTSNDEENDINEPELEHTYLESETLNAVSYTHLTLPTNREV